MFALASIVNEYQCSEQCADNIVYLKTRHRWTQELEDELVRLHKEDNPPIIFDFDFTKETGEALMETAEAEARKRKE